MEQNTVAMKQKIVALERNKAAFRQNREKTPDFPKINFFGLKTGGFKPPCAPANGTRAFQNGQ